MKIIAALGLSAFLLSGCAMSITDVKYLDTPDGKPILCAGNADGGLDCNWEEYNK